MAHSEGPWTTQGLLILRDKNGSGLPSLGSVEDLLPPCHSFPDPYYFCSAVKVVIRNARMAVRSKVVEMMSKVRLVPRSGRRMRTGRNVPRMLPAVDRA